MRAGPAQAGDTIGTEYFKTTVPLLLVCEICNVFVLFFFTLSVVCLDWAGFDLILCLCCRGQVRLVHGSGATGLQLVQSYSDSDEDSDGAWEGRLGDRYNPPGNLYSHLAV